MADVPVVKQGGWGDESKGKTTRRNRGESAPEEDERLKMTVPVEEDSDDDIPEIPELQDQVEEEEDITTKVAEAPTANIQMATMADLDKELSSTLSFTQTDSGVDLKLLINNLTPSHLLKEEDKEWDFVHVFTEIKSELAAEEEKSKKDEASSNDLLDNPMAAI
ncbi:hypothetical protein PTSG_04872 [Salpingoeca rosetta]|uniref:Uncharacterized protein n=1 Tax=Salpingoeca rosetta (strain ATCC 50818 / BSB-021) TaxID=946362 RepID=F2U8V6_SALR5|nr:uncharacterized protein PTSG_04872 [Salpingoeca rosetta]EGD73159.1 hypothetical protein PTSG_04872 [Salpingoeca rosetta]|eukprot:XP_004994190.1 hypothetical protein PTSG_04872 [Salpingoeca rosetta]